METALCESTSWFGWIIMLIGFALLLAFVLLKGGPRNVTSVKAADGGMGIGGNALGIALVGDVTGDVTQNQAQGDEPATSGQPHPTALSDRVTTWLGIAGTVIAVVGSFIELFNDLAALI